MFEDSLIPQARRKAGHRKAQLLKILEEDAYEQVVLRVEAAGQWSFCKKDRADVLRRVRLMYRGRDFPQATFEDWHSLTDDESNGDVDGIEPAMETLLELNDFDAFAVRSIVHELKLTGGFKSNVLEDGLGTCPPQRLASSFNSPHSDSSSDESTGSSSENSSDSDSANPCSSSDFSDRETLLYDASEMEHLNCNPERRRKRTQVPVDPDSTDSDEGGDSADPNVVFARKKLKQWANEGDNERSWLKDRYILHKAGFELYDDLELTAHDSARRQHAVSLKTILHLKILERNWQTAFKTFSLLAKLSFVDLRSLWPLGIEILTQLREQARTGILKGASSGRQEQLKIQQFYDWMTLAFPMYGKPLVSFFLTQGPVFRTGSRTYTPIYRIAGLWNLLSEKQYSLLRDKLNEIMLIPPYAQDGVFCYMLILCCLSENEDLLSVFGDFDAKLDEILDGSCAIGDLAEDMSLLASKESIKTRVFRNIAEVHGLMDKCDALNFQFSKTSIQDVILKTRVTLDGILVDPKKTDHDISVKLPSIHYSLERAKVSPTSATSKTIPKKYWNRLVVESNRGGTKHWVGCFYDFSKPNKAICLVCGQLQTLRQRAKLKAHLGGHKITSENQTEEKDLLIAFDMAEMVRLQGRLPLAPQKAIKQKASRVKRRPPPVIKKLTNMHDLPMPLEIKEIFSSDVSTLLGNLESTKNRHDRLESTSDRRSVPASVKDTVCVEARDIPNFESFDQRIRDGAIEINSDHSGLPMNHLKISLNSSEADADKDCEKEHDDDSPECSDSDEYSVNRIDDSLDGQMIAKSRNKGNLFKGFSPDTTQENVTIAQDLSRDISRDFYQFATQTQESQRRSELLEKPELKNEIPGFADWRSDFSMDLYQADSSVDFTQVLPSSASGNASKTSEREEEFSLFSKEGLRESISDGVSFKSESDSS